jgi:hypothetical protein
MPHIPFISTDNWDVLYDELDDVWWTEFAYFIKIVESWEDLSSKCQVDSKELGGCTLGVCMLRYWEFTCIVHVQVKKMK